MAEQPILLRTVLVDAMPDADWAATQVAPSASICADVSTVASMGAMFIALDAAGDVVASAGTMDLALIDVATSLPLPPGRTSRTLVKTTPVDTNVHVGDGLEYNVSGSRLVTIRINASALNVAVAKVEIYWNCLVQG